MITEISLPFFSIRNQNLPRFHKRRIMEEIGEMEETSSMTRITNEDRVDGEQ